MNSALKKIWSWWDGFWFDPKDLRPLAAMRIVVAGTFFYIYLVRGLFNMNYFNGQWMVPRDRAFELFHEITRPYLTWFFWPDSMAGAVHSLYVILLFLILLGLANRPLMFFAWILHIGFIHRNYAVIYGADLMGTVFLLYLSMTKCCDVWTFKNKLFKQKNNWISSDWINSIGFRFIQIHIAVIYAYTGFEKLKGASWWDGTALWSVFGNPQIVVFDMTFMRNFPVLIAVTTFVTVLYEIYWPAAVLTKARNAWLLAGVMFHIGIGFLMNIWAFSLVMLATYFLFIDFNKIPQAWLKRLKLG